MPPLLPRRGSERVLRYTDPAIVAAGTTTSADRHEVLREIGITVGRRRYPWAFGLNHFSSFRGMTVNEPIPGAREARAAMVR